MTIHQRRDDYPNPWRIQVRGHPARREDVRLPPRATGDLVRDLRGMDVAFSPVSNDG